MSFRLALKYVPVLFTLCLAPAAFPQASAAGAQTGAQVGGATVKGLVADPDSAVIPGATVTLTPASGKAFTVPSGSDGTYTLSNIPAGTYSLTVTMNGFATFVRQGIKITPGQALTMNAKLVIQDQQQVVQVTADSATLSVDQDSNASSTVISGKDLDALSDDPDELSSELSALAGPAAGPNGGQIYIDGFTGGQLPPKSSIREIRINQNPFSAQYDKPGFGRVEVFTKPGTDKLHGSAQMMGNDKSFNSGQPPISTGVQQPGYHTIFSQGSLTGAISKSSSYTLAGSYRSIQDNAIINGTIYAPTANSATLCAPGQAGCVSSIIQAANPLPQLRYDFSPRLDFALGDKNTLTVRFQGYENDHTNSGVGSTDLASTGYNTKSSEYELQVSDTQIYSARVINETRFELGRNVDSQAAQSFTPTVNVQGSFTSGGAPTGSGTTRQARLEVQNYTSINLGKNFIRLGGRLRANRESMTTTAGSNGVLTYACLLTGTIDPNTGNSDTCQAGSDGKIHSYQANLPSQFSYTSIRSGVNTTYADLGLYAETDWKPRPNLTISYGFRYETQSQLGDHHDFAPRVSFAYGFGKSNPKTVLRGGYGFFYDRYQIGNVLTTLQKNGVNQVQTLIQNPAAGCVPTTTAIAIATCSGTPDLSKNVTTSAAPNLRTPYLMQTQIGVDQQLFKGATVSINYINSRGTHQFLTQNIGLNGTKQLSPQTVAYQYQSEGVFRQNQLITNVNWRASRYSIFGYYVLNFAKADTGGITSSPSTPGSIGVDYGRAQFDVRNRLFLGGNVSLPYHISLSPFVVAQSGQPFNVTLGSDFNNDSIFNDRPVFSTPNAFAAGTTGSNTIAGCGSFGTPAAVTDRRIPINYCTGPALFTFNLRAAKTIGFGPERAPSGRSGRQGGGDQGGPPQMRGGGGPGGGGGGARGGGGGPMGGGGANTGKRYNLTLAAQVQNLFNNNDLSTPNGTLGSRQFGQSTQLAGTIYTSNSAARRIMLQASFNF